MKVFFDTVGCRLNQAEIEEIAGQFRAAGHTILESNENADLVILNSCSVTAAAASDSRQKVRQAHIAGAREILITGCLATLDTDTMASLPGVTHVVTNQSKNNIASLVLGDQALFDLEPLARKPLPGIHRKTRAYIKVQDGCDNFCSFCVTSIARGPSVSIPEVSIVYDVLAAVAGGTHEVVLTGVNLGSWGRDLPGKKDLAWLVKFLLNETSIDRIRLSSTEPWDLDEEFFDLWQSDRMCRHIHLPLQSGSASVLRRMVRNTTPEKFRSLVNQARNKISGLAITTDIIVGFPGESDAEFEESLAFINEMCFTGGHVFKFSPRPGTAAARLPGRLHGSLAAERSSKIRCALEDTAKQFALEFIGKELSVLWERAQKVNENQWLMHGLSDNYLQIESLARENRSNKLDRVKVNELNNGSLLADIIF